MCGLAGFLSLANAAEAEMRHVAFSMVEAIKHRGPNDEGVWVDENAGFAVGHRRLSVLDLSSAGHQPMTSRSGRFVIAYNGEIYNHVELRRLLGASVPDASWRGHSDTETLLACIEAWGVERTLRAAVGMFAIALWDRHMRVLTLVRDRAGEKPLYYGWQGQTFLFGSELRALKRHPDFQAGIDRGALSLLLRFNVIPAPHSIYENVYKLPPGAWLQIDAASRQQPPEVARYWSLSEVADRGAANAFQGSEHDALAALDAHLGAAVRRQMLSDVPIGALLSGGIDSSAIAALMQESSTRPIRTFTIGFSDGAYDEAADARAVASHLGTQHTELRLSGEDTQKLVPRIADIYDEPFADSSQLPTYVVMKLASENVTVALSGDAGDELFGGYNRYVYGPKIWKMMGRVPYEARRAVGSGLQAIPSDTLNRFGGPLGRRLGISQPGDKAHKLGRRLTEVRSLGDLWLSMVTEWPNAEAVVVDGHMPRSAFDGAYSSPRIEDPVTRMMVSDAMSYLPDDILVKVDRAAMSVSLETRAPFLDRDLMEFAATIPLHMKIRNGRGKWLLRELLNRRVPRQLFERPKMGFGIPLNAWLRGPLREWADTLLAPDRLAREGFFHPQPIRKAWELHSSGRASYGHRLWSVLMFQSWLERAV